MLTFLIILAFLSYEAAYFERMGKLFMYEPGNSFPSDEKDIALFSSFFFNEKCYMIKLYSIVCDKLSGALLRRIRNVGIRVVKNLLQLFVSYLYVQNTTPFRTLSHSSFLVQKFPPILNRSSWLLRSSTSFNSNIPHPIKNYLSLSSPGFAELFNSHSASCLRLYVLHVQIEFWLLIGLVLQQVFL